MARPRKKDYIKAIYDGLNKATSEELKAVNEYIDNLYKQVRLKELKEQRNILDKQIAELEGGEGGTSNDEQKASENTDSPKEIVEVNPNAEQDLHEVSQEVIDKMNADKK